MREKLKEVIYETLVKKRDMMSLFGGILIGNLAWAIQPDSSQGLMLVQKGMSEPFWLMVILALFFIIGLFCIRFYRKYLKKQCVKSGGSD